MHRKDLGLIGSFGPLLGLALVMGCSDISKPHPLAVADTYLPSTRDDSMATSVYSLSGRSMSSGNVILVGFPVVRAAKLPAGLAAPVPSTAADSSTRRGVVRLARQPARPGETTTASERDDSWAVPNRKLSEIRSDSDTAHVPVPDEPYPPSLSGEGVRLLVQPQPSIFPAPPSVDDLPVSQKVLELSQGIHANALPRTNTQKFKEPSTSDLGPLPARKPNELIAPALDTAVVENHQMKTQRAINASSRSVQMNVVALEVARHVGRGFNLADRGAYFAARSQFVQSLRLLTQALDAKHHTACHSQALAAGMRALDEAEDFVPRGSRLEADLDLPMLIAGHHTPALKSVNSRELSPLIAQRRYYSYAQEQLGIATPGEPAGSMALYGLGKIHNVIAAQPAPSIFAAESKALAYHHAALQTDSRNYLAANELAVLLVKSGYLPSARALLQQSVAGSPQPAAWHNLALVHRYLGEPQLSALAEHESAAAAEGLGAKTQSDNSLKIEWVDAKTFADSSRAATGVTINPVATAAAVLPSASTPWQAAVRNDAKPMTRDAFKPFWQRK